MCTVTAFFSPADPPARGGIDADPLLVRISCNRDEQRSREPSLSPRVIRSGGSRAVMPIDPASGGSWIGASERGLVACLLNANPVASGESRVVYEARHSRGPIVPRMLRAACVLEALVSALELDASHFPPFRLLLIDAHSHAVVTSTGLDITCARLSCSRSPLMLTSSGLGDHTVQSVRHELFQRMLGAHPDAFQAQDRFHAHSWPRRGALSILMSRPDARTVSQTVIDLRVSSIAIHHATLGDDLRPERRAPMTVLPLAIAGVAA